MLLQVLPSAKIWNPPSRRARVPEKVPCRRRLEDHLSSFHPRSFAPPSVTHVYFPQCLSER